MSNLNTTLIRQINERPGKATIAATGGGASFIGDYLAVGGGSATILEFYVPYDQRSFDNYVSGKPTNYAGDDAARKLAVASYERAAVLAGKADAIGIGAACSIATANEREGRFHRISVACHTAKHTETLNVVLKQGATRESEEAYVSQVILAMLAYATGIDTSLPERLPTTETYEGAINKVEPDWDSLINGERKYISYGEELPKRSIVLFPGSFNPMHEGHQEMYDHAKSIFHVNPVLEVTVKNADKPPIDWKAIKDRVDNLGSKNLLLTKAPKFLDKLKLLRGELGYVQVTFVVGADTWARIFDPRFVVDGEIEYFIKTNTRFLVFSRNELTPESVPYEYRGFAKSLLVTDSFAQSFREDSSSSAIRKAAEKL